MKIVLKNISCNFVILGKIHSGRGAYEDTFILNNSPLAKNQGKLAISSSWAMGQFYPVSHSVVPKLKLKCGSQFHSQKEGGKIFYSQYVRKRNLAISNVTRLCQMLTQSGCLNVVPPPYIPLHTHAFPLLFSRVVFNFYSE